MKITEKSSAEIEIVQTLQSWRILRDKQLLSVEDIDEIIGDGWKVQAKCEELRESRDSWRLRAEEAESKLKVKNEQ